MTHSASPLIPTRTVGGLNGVPRADPVRYTFTPPPTLAWVISDSSGPVTRWTTAPGALGRLAAFGTRACRLALIALVRTATVSDHQRRLRVWLDDVSANNSATITNEQERVVGSLSPCGAQVLASCLIRRRWYHVRDRAREQRREVRRPTRPRPIVLRAR
eukprot:scaffold56745_cov63-Phaeocystis_antarctica.AAC.2